MRRPMIAGGTVTTDGYRRFLNLVKSRWFQVVCIIIVCVVLVVSYGIYRSINPSIQRVTDEGVLAGISPDDVDYESMRPEILNAQLDRQIGLTLDELKVASINNNTFDTFEDTFRAARALRSTGDYPKALQVFAVAEKNTNSLTGYVFYYEYASLLAGYKDSQSQARLMYERTLERVKADENLSQATKDDAVKRIKFAIATMSAEDAL